MNIVTSILLHAFLLFLVGQFVRGIEVRDAKAALFGAVALGLVNTFVRPLMVLLTLPINVLTLGLFLLVINALVLMLAAALVEGFEVEDFGAAFWGALVFAAMNVIAGWVV
jgi:putative membrane protein